MLGKYFNAVISKRKKLEGFSLKTYSNDKP